MKNPTAKSSDFYPRESAINCYVFSAISVLREKGYLPQLRSVVPPADARGASSPGSSHSEIGRLPLPTGSE